MYSGDNFLLALRLPKDLERRLEKLARRTGRTKSYYAKEAIAQFLEEREDYLLGVSVLERRCSTGLSNT